jgi:hypothetical protein
MNGDVERSLDPDQLRTRLASLILKRRVFERPRQQEYSSLS